VDAPAIRRHDDGDAATILPIETGQAGLQNVYVRAARAVRWPKV
jgi:hypothetical protein